jgi:hypothetical protein
MVTMPVSYEKVMLFGLFLRNPVKGRGPNGALRPSDAKRYAPPNLNLLKPFWRLVFRLTIIFGNWSFIYKKFTI